jgi:hypothetical protein
VSRGPPEVRFAPIPAIPITPAGLGAGQKVMRRTLAALTSSAYKDRR